MSRSFAAPPTIRRIAARRVYRALSEPGTGCGTPIVTTTAPIWRSFTPAKDLPPIQLLVTPITVDRAYHGVDTTVVYLTRGLKTAWQRPMVGPRLRRGVVISSTDSTTFRTHMTSSRQDLG
jgi:hypothetical protein